MPDIYPLHYFIELDRVEFQNEDKILNYHGNN